jgi:hypothetical protein
MTNNMNKKNIFVVFLLCVCSFVLGMIVNSVINKFSNKDGKANLASQENIENSNKLKNNNSGSSGHLLSPPDVIPFKGENVYFGKIEMVMPDKIKIGNDGQETAKEISINGDTKYFTEEIEKKPVDEQINNDARIANPAIEITLEKKEVGKDSFSIGQDVRVVLDENGVYAKEIIRQN